MLCKAFTEHSFQYSYANFAHQLFYQYFLLTRYSIVIHISTMGISLDQYRGAIGCFNAGGIDVRATLASLHHSLQYRINRVNDVPSDCTSSPIPAYSYRFSLKYATLDMLAGQDHMKGPWKLHAFLLITLISILQVISHITSYIALRKNPDHNSFRNQYSFKTGVSLLMVNINVHLLQHIIL